MNSVMDLFGGSKGTAGYPATDYPAGSFFGPGSLQPKGGTAEVAHNVTPQSRKQMVCVIIALIAIGYVLWHFNYIK